MQRHLPLDRINHSINPDWVLNADELTIRHQQYGDNNIVENADDGLMHIVKDTLLDPMIWFLFITGILFLWLGEYSEALILWFAILPIGGMDAFLHWRTQVSTQALKSKLVIYTAVIRDGGEIQIPANQLVPGDLVRVRAGEYFPADGVLLEVNHLQVDESSLTGEAFPVTKQALKVLPSHQVNSLVPYSYWGMVGTHVLTGDALMRVVYTGKETLYGEIVDSVIESQHHRTPLQVALMKLVVTQIMVASIFCLILAVVRFYQGFGMVDAILNAATLAVAALPDEFPMVFTFFLGVGVYRLAQKHALVRRAVSVENIGRVTTICTDKTGTVTEGKFNIKLLEPIHAMDQQTLLDYACLASRHESHDPLDETILHASTIANSLHVDHRLHMFPFTEERKRETAMYAQGEHTLTVTKGAPEIILAMCHLDHQHLDYWQHRISDLASEGYKIIGCARKIVPHISPNSQNTGCDELNVEPENNYEWLGLLVFIDPPRAEVYDAIRYCQAHSLHVLMITGDHPDTARSVAAEIGLGNGAPNVITASEADDILKTRGAAFLRHVHVIARAVPAQKFAIVKALHSLDEVVVVTGDGVNDVPALRAADIGIAMGARGTQSAREAASIVLLDDNFGSIVNAINEGKQLFKNLQLSFKYVLMIHIPYVLSATLIPLLGFPLLYYPIQIVCIELFIHPTCMLVFQEMPDKSMVPRYPDTRGRVSFFSRLDWWGIILIGIYTTVLVLGAYLISLRLTGNPAVARADAFVVVGLTHIALTIGLSRFRTLTARVVILASVLMLLALVQIPALSHYFNMQPPTLITWFVLSVASVVTAGLAWRFS